MKQKFKKGDLVEVTIGKNTFIAPVIDVNNGVMIELGELYAIVNERLCKFGLSDYYHISAIRAADKKSAAYERYTRRLA
ncbi:MAG: hypothetical protein Q4A27_02475 [bacterium]|nr:hypothetical protein [bacterium]